MNLFGLWRLNCSVCVSWTRPSALSRDSRGKCISPAPHFLLSAGLSFPAGCVLAARFAGCGRGPSLHCVHIRCAAPAALFLPGGNAVSFHIPGIMRNRGYIAAYSQKLEPCKSFFHSVSSLHDMNCGENLPAVRRTGPEPPIRGARVCPECGSNNRDIRPDFRVFRRSCGRRRRPFPPPAPRARRAAESQSSAMERC